MPRYRLELNTAFAGVDDTIYIESSEPLEDRQIQEHAEQWIELNWNLEQIDEDEMDEDADWIDWEDWG